MASTKELRAALKEALELFAHAHTFSDGRLKADPDTGEPRSPGSAWVRQARLALGLDPIYGQRRRRARKTNEDE